MPNNVINANTAFGWNRRVAIALLSFGMMAVMAPTSAQDTALKPYDVELVVFRTANPMGSPEDWALEESRAKQSLPASREADEPGGESAPSTAPTAAFVTAVGSESSIQPLESARYKLTGVEAT